MKTITNFQGYLVHKFLNFLFFLFKSKINLFLFFLTLFYSVTAFGFDVNISNDDVLLVNSVVNENSFLTKGSNDTFSDDLNYSNSLFTEKYSFFTGGSGVDILFDDCLDSGLNFNDSEVCFSYMQTTPITTIESSQCNSVLDSYLTPIYAIPVARALKYKFKVVDSNNIARYFESNSNSFLLTDVRFLPLSSNVSFQVSVAVSLRSGFFGDYGPSCSITTPPALFTQLVDSQCGSVLSSFSSPINAVQVSDATSYKFRISSGSQLHSGGAVDLEYVSDTPQFRLTDIPNRRFVFDYTYNISVAVGQNGYYHPYSNVCTIKTPPAVITSVIDSQCGATLPALDSFITASPVSGASAYKFEVGYMNGMRYYEYVTSPTRQFKLTDISNYSHFTYGKTYTVRVCVAMDNGVFGPYGDVCNITTPTKIQNSQCGVTLSNINDIIYADYVNTTKYKFKIVGNGSTTTHVSNSRSFKLTDVEGLRLDYGTAYNISVAVEINSHPSIIADSNGIKWSDFGTVCNIVTPVQVTTNVISSQCGITLPAVNSFITANSVSGASAYKFKIVGGNINTEYVSQTRQFKLTDIPNVTVEYGTNYSISVSAMKNGVYYDYGSACNVSTPLPIYSSILSSQCGTSLVAVNSSITANSVSGASSYKFKIVGGNINTEYVSQTRQFRLTDLPNATILLATNYTISVAANVNGVYHPFGSQCIVITPEPSIQASHCGITLTNIRDDIYANYIVGASEYKFKVIDGSSVYYITNASRVFKLSDVNGLVLQYGKTYQVSVAVNYNNVWTSYGVSCNISTPPPTYAYITSLVCTDNVPVDYVRDDNDYIYATILPGATSYKFLLTVREEFYPNPLIWEYIYESSTNKFRLSDIVNLSIKPQSKFSIQVAAKQNGFYNPYGNPCFVYSPTPRIKQSECGKTLSTLNETITADLVHYGGNYASDYHFYVKKDGVSVGTVYESNSPSFNLTNVLSNISYDATYEVFVRAKVLGSWYNPIKSCYINTPPTSSIIDSQCGSTLSELNSSITAKSITNATQYKFRVIGSDFTAEYTNSVRSFRLTDIQSQGFTIAYGTTYQVSVSVFVNGVWRDFGTTCNITTPAKYTTLIDSHCGMTIASFGSSITANSVSGATSYKFKVVGENFSAEYISQIRQFRLTDLTNVQILPGTTYQISVAVGQNGLYHPYGTACSITTPPAFYTNIIASQCGTTLPSYNSFITANPVSGATSYKFKVVGGNIDIEYISQTRQFKLTDIPNAIVELETDYSISVAAMKDGVYNPYGDICIVSTPPLSKIQSSQCGIVLTDVSDDIIADFVYDVTQYKFKVSDGVSTDKYFINSIRALKLTNVTDLDLKYGTSYQVSVSVNINNVWSDFGDICTITTPTLDVFPSIVPSQCGTVLADVNDFIIASSVTDANLYKFKVVGPNLNMEYASLTNQFKLTDLNQTISFGAAYQVSVAVNINGAWSSYGPVCTITTPSNTTVIDSNLCGSTLDSFDSLITAIPLPNITSYKFKVTSNEYFYFTEEFVSSNNQFRLTDLVRADQIRPNVTYLVSVACGVNGSYGDYSSICNITTPRPKLVSPICGSTIRSINDTISCLSVPGAINYTYTVYSGNDSDNLFYRGSYTSSVNTFKLSDIPNSNLYFGPNITFMITISVYTSGSSNGFTFYSDSVNESCFLYSPNFSTNIIASQCGVTLQGLDTTIYANPVVDATQYRFEVFSANPVTGVLNVLNTHYSTLNEFKLTDVPNLNVGYNKSYAVKVYAKAYDMWSTVSNTCIVRTPVSGPITTVINSSLCGSTLNSYDSLITAISVPNATSYKFKVVDPDTNNVEEFVSSNNQFRLTDLNTTLRYGVAYRVSVAVYINGAWSIYGSVCTITTPSYITVIASNLCGSTLDSFNSLITANPLANVTVTSYRFKVVDPVTNDIEEYVSLNNQFRFSDLTNTTLRYGIAYQVSVAVKVNNTWSSYGSVCSISFLGTPSITPSFCGRTLNSYDSLITAIPFPNATSYKFKVVHPVTNVVQEFVSSNNQFSLVDLNTTLRHGFAYQVSVAVKVNNAWSSYGSVCTISTPLPAIESTVCGRTLNSVDSLITAIPLPGVTSYKFKIQGVVDSSFDYTMAQLESSSNQFRLTDLDISDFPFSSYKVSVACGVNGVYGSYGPSCLISIPSLNIDSHVCGSSLTSFNDTISCNSFPGAIRYDFKIYSQARHSYAGVFLNVAPYRTTYTSSTNSFKLSDVPNLYLDPDYAYEVLPVAVLSTSNGEKYFSTNTTRPYCRIYGPNVTNDFSTSIIESQCSIIVTDPSMTFYANPVVGATEYRFDVHRDWLNEDDYIEYEFYAPHYTTLNEFKLTDVQGINFVYGYYYIKVYAKVNDRWSFYTTNCSFKFIPPTIKSSDNNMESVNQKTVVDKNRFMISVYPNPFATSFTLDVVSESKSNILVNVFDISGRLIETRNVSFDELSSYKFGDSYSAGVYTVTVEQDGNVDTLKVIKP